MTKKKTTKPEKKEDQKLILQDDTLFVMKGEHHLDNIHREYKNSIKKVVVYGGVLKYKRDKVEPGEFIGEEEVDGETVKKYSPGRRTKRYPYDIQVSRGKLILDE